MNILAALKLSGISEGNWVHLYLKSKLIVRVYRVQSVHNSIITIGSVHGIKNKLIFNIRDVISVRRVQIIYSLEYAITVTKYELEYGTIVTPPSEY